MAQRRMFNKTITNSDKFLEMPDSSQNLYFHLSMNADDDGFVDNWKSILKMTGCKEDDLKILITKNYLIPFESGVIVIRHWRMNNYLQKDRIIPTNYKEEKSMLNTDLNNVYILDTNCIHSIDKYSIDKSSIDNIYSPTSDEVLDDINPVNDTIKQVIDYFNSKANTKYQYNNNHFKNHIKARINQGFNIEDFIKVIDIKCDEWLNTDMQKYLRPQTLFGSKFETYLNQQNFKKKEITIKKTESVDLNTLFGDKK